MIYRPHQYQIDAARFMLGRPHSALFADPGTGKTSILLMVLHQLKKGTLEAPVLITAPLRIATQVWPEEIAKWDQFSHFSCRILHGRHKKAEAEKPADIHLVNNEGLPWLSKLPCFDQYKILIIDESSKFKNWSAQRTKILRYKLGQFERRHILTGSPAPRSLLDVFAQMYLCDGGRTLGRYYTHYRARYFVDNGFHGVYPDWQPRPGAEEQVYRAIAPSCYRLDGQELLDMPDMVVNDIKLNLPRDIIDMSLDTLRNLNLDLPLSAAAEYGQARQIAGGVAANGTRIHDIKLRALVDLLDELQGKNALVFYYYRAEGRLLSKTLNAPRIDGGTGAAESKRLIDRWNAGTLPILLLQPAAAGHGLNLQRGGNHVVWYSLTDNQDDYYQANRRIWRQGVKGTVYVHRLIARSTVDVAMCRSLEAKTGQQKALLDAIRELIG